MSNSVIHHPSSYRDPSGFIFEKDGTLYRQVNLSYKDHFDYFIESGCYDHLSKKGLIVSHEDATHQFDNGAGQYKVIKPERIGFVSYPYEWSFDMLKNAALLTLQVAKEALSFNMILKDATPFNIQWHNGKFIFIDTLSFEKYEERPWIAYRQFCECFIGPLLIMHYSRRHLPSLFLSWPEGIPLRDIVALIPKRSRFSLHTYLHIHLHAKYSARQAKGRQEPGKLTKPKLLNLVRSLEMLVSKLKVPPAESTWSGYYEEATTRNDYLDQKRNIIDQWLNNISGVMKAADLGANKGEFSKLLAERKIYTIAADFDPYCINEFYLTKERSSYIQPIVLDLATPSPSIGVNNEERASFLNRGNFDLCLALALIHHLTIGKNIPFPMVARLFSLISKKLIIEFIPKEDEKVRMMLSTREDIFPGYTEQNFCEAFGQFFTIADRKPIPGSTRVLFLMERHVE